MQAPAAHANSHGFAYERRERRNECTSLSAEPAIPIPEQRFIICTVMRNPSFQKTCLLFYPMTVFLSSQKWKTCKKSKKRGGMHIFC